MMRSLAVLLALTLMLIVSPGCGYNKIQGLDEEVKASWGEVLNQYQRRYDLIPNLVNTVKGAAAHERETLQSVVEARAQVGRFELSSDMLQDPQTLRQFQEAQSQLGSALQRLLVVVERYPDLKANQSFLTLQSQLEGTENRITVARRRYIEAVKAFNKAVRYFPSNITAKYILHLKPVETFQPKNPAVENAPEVQF